MVSCAFSSNVLQLICMYRLMIMFTLCSTMVKHHMWKYSPARSNPPSSFAPCSCNLHNLLWLVWLTHVWHNLHDKVQLWKDYFKFWINCNDKKSFKIQYQPPNLGFKFMKFPLRNLPHQRFSNNNKCSLQSF
jgi:hypothetical protein